MEAAAVYCPRRDTGVDLGTTFSCVAVFEDGEIFVIPNDAATNNNKCIQTKLPIGQVLSKHALWFNTLFPEKVRNA